MKSRTIWILGLASIFTVIFVAVITMPQIIEKARYTNQPLLAIITGSIALVCSLIVTGWIRVNLKRVNK
ncbi:hypothetical protein M0R04_08250 [Candidatus Dojkabacteria bacterium]|jgi:hypothetical protein|nr:hypothetical protein [Candidatus Dojkabacteria bacterium]